MFTIKVIMMNDGKFAMLNRPKIQIWGAQLNSALLFKFVTPADGF